MDNYKDINDLSIKAKFRYEVAMEYGISVKTLNRWIKSYNLSIPKGIINPHLLKILYVKFGPPGNQK
jgi:hypothetical protein